MQETYLFSSYLRKPQICSLSKLTSKELFRESIVTAQDYFQNLFESSKFNWKKKYFF